MNHPYLPLLVFLGVALLVPVSALTLARLWMHWFTPIKRGHEKNALYECGVHPLADRQQRFHSPYYLFGLLFLIFDVEAVFLIPFAVAFLQLDVSSCLIALLFLLLLAEGLAWAWSKGMLDWHAARSQTKPAHGRS